ncbi:protein phosphatase 2C domain-containing protein [Mycolicibacterium sp. BiH015]|uniref:PP2C family protein-serine/threonine phosphatase n=1 Tax=Mycolicibacterium sp. BiH015 TaxID=3018808 RepID=UPI0022E1D24C|nr:protein phosphatase 2C domain-containing protein [Mycolicibacterium sp. BiH015]MDA2891165.1 protein phosphatase 2C domain-containing protein [Mycolicibacterium sp. BiH015]
MSGDITTCRRCTGPVTTDDRFCEQCGHCLAAFTVVSIPGTAGIGGPCSDCGNTSFADAYCTVCGAAWAGPDREETDVFGVALITDRGIAHARNEDCVAAGVVDTLRYPSFAISICDGVSTSSAAHTAARAASTAGVEAMLSTLASCGTGTVAVLAGMSSAAIAAAATTGTDPSEPPSCTYTGAVVVRVGDGTVQISVGNVGDSRAYWIPDPPGRPVQLTIDDTVAQELMSAGAHAGSEAVRAGAHVLTHWLGADADPTPWSESGVHAITVTAPGLLLLCSDGLWNYLPDAEEIAAFCVGTDVHVIGRALVDHALSAGGHDNITVAVVPIGDHHESR